MAAVAKDDAMEPVRKTIVAYRDRVHVVRNDTNYLPPEGVQIMDDSLATRILRHLHGAGRLDMGGPIL